MATDMHECATCYCYPDSGSPAFSVCSRCKITRYCSHECQQISSSLHKKFCNKPKIMLNKADYKKLGPGSVIWTCDDLLRFRDAADIPSVKGPDKIAYVKVFRSWPTETEAQRFSAIGPFHMVCSHSKSYSASGPSGPDYPGQTATHHDVRYSIVGPFHPAPTALWYIIEMLRDCVNEFEQPTQDITGMFATPPCVKPSYMTMPAFNILDAVLQQDANGFATIAEVHILIMSRATPQNAWKQNGDRMIMAIDIEANPEVAEH
ncbi:hypothetical protein BU23DRAFT_5050 [Bimuria novae-zelandiae CBS 107.79]|uniref:MYND-type domain-containing protein n=1 Tax=Bimuria novae-zelandiae CBS 107.79 TaxID=1447943 RepID=A0A6A5VTL3_9PLEO|nr:hypothetical protein BU23DRAFT_5050 [Bimuria novae-zelandiae CBS 107.79]